jgi:hypothetical protein
MQAHGLEILHPENASTGRENSLIITNSFFDQLIQNYSN